MQEPPAYKLPGKTLAESLGLEIPDNAPGGQKLPLPRLASSAPNRAKSQNIGNVEYDGFYDEDAHGGPIKETKP